MKVKVGESWFLLYECLGEIVSVDDTMVNEIDLFPPKPKGLVVFDPTRFLPDWKKQGRRTRLQMAKDTYNNQQSTINQSIWDSQNDPDTEKWFRSQKIIQISKYLKCKIKHKLVLKGHPPDLWRYPGLVRIRKEGTWITLRKLPRGIHSEELPSGLVETWAT